MTTFEPNTRIRVKQPKPLPSGATVKLVGSVWYVKDGIHVVRISTPGLYGGGILRLTADDIEAI